MIRPANAYASSTPESRLAALDWFPVETRMILASLGVTDHRQLAALLENPEVAPHLRAITALSEDVVARVLAPPTKHARSGTATDKAAIDAWDVDSVATPVFGAALPPEAALKAMTDLPTRRMKATTPLPAAVNLVAQMPSIGAQGSRFTCVAFAATAVHAVALGNSVDLSEQHLYFEAKQVDGIPASCETYLSSAAGVLKSVGQCREEVWSYRGSAPCNNHGPLPATARSDAALRTIALRPIKPKDVLGMKMELTAGRPVAFSVTAFSGWSKSKDTWSSGRITMPVTGEIKLGAHAMVLVGYQDVPSGEDVPPGGGFFIVRNSWDTRWGRQCPFGAGYGMMPYAYIAEYGGEAFTLA